MPPLAQRDTDYRIGEVAGQVALLRDEIADARHEILMRFDNHDQRAIASAAEINARLGRLEVSEGVRQGQSRAEEKHEGRAHEWSMTSWVIVVGGVAAVVGGAIAGALGPLVTLLVGGKL